MMKKSLYILYAVFCYLAFIATCVYWIGFTGNLIVPRTVDTAITASIPVAIAINTLLIAVFGISHSVMARQSFKDWWTSIIPQAIERSTYVLVSCLMMMLLVWQWRSIDIIIWDVSSTVAGIILWLGFWSGWVLVFLSSFLIDHFDFVGLRQVYLNARDIPYTQLQFVVRSLYHLVRHPLQLGLILCFWSTPLMTAGHLLLAVIMLIYIFIGLAREERDLEATFGEDYREYKSKTRMLIPIPRIKSK